MAQGRADERAVEGHLGHARGEVVAALAPVVRNPRGEELLQAGEGAGCEDLCTEWVALELLEVCLQHGASVAGIHGIVRNRIAYGTTHSKIAIWTAALGQRLADLVQEVVLALAGAGARRGIRHRFDGLLFEFDRHGALNRAQQAVGGG